MADASCFGGCFGCFGALLTNNTSPRPAGFPEVQASPEENLAEQFTLSVSTKPEDTSLAEPITEIPQVQYVKRDVFKEVTRIDYVEKFVEVPEVHYVDRVVEVEKVEYKERLVEVPKVEYRERVIEKIVTVVKEVEKHVTKVVVQDIVKEVPKEVVQIKQSSTTALSNKYSVGNGVEVLRSDGQWSRATISETGPKKMSVVLLERGPQGEEMWKDLDSTQVRDCLRFPQAMAPATASSSPPQAHPASTPHKRTSESVAGPSVSRQPAAPQPARPAAQGQQRTAPGASSTPQPAARFRQIV